MLITSCHMKSTFPLMSKSIKKLFIFVAYNKRRWHFKSMIVFDFQFMRSPLIKFLHLSNLLQVPNDCRMFDIVFFSYFSYSCKRISFNDSIQLVIVNFWWLAIMPPLLISKALVSFAKLLEPPLHCMFISSSEPKSSLMLVVVSAALWHNLKSNLKNCSNLLFV